jgi:hypothetical protein
MSSTSNKNQLSDYTVKKKESTQYEAHRLDINYAVHQHTQFMDLGSIPTFRGDQLAKNRTDIESMLRGIRSTNLEGPSFSATPENHILESKAWFEKPAFVFPEPFEHSITQRPNY